MYTGTGLASARGESLEVRSYRQLVVAVLASLVLHALILLGLSYVKDGQRMRAAAVPLTARLAKPESSPEQTKVEPHSPAPLPAPRPAGAAKAVPQTAAPVRVPAAPVSSMETSSKAEEPTPGAPIAPAQPAARSEARAEVPPGPAAASGPDPGSVARFRLELMEIARRYKRYPRIAQDNNWEGRVELRIAFSESGAISSLSVRKGTGRAVLDEQAQAMIRSAQAQASIPPALRGKAFTLDIPVDFFLKEEK